MIDLFNVRYYVNPNVPLKTYKACGNKNIQMDFNTQNIDYTAISNLFMVGKQRTRRLFIDSTGTEIVSETFEDGKSSIPIVLQKEGGNLPCFSKTNKSPHIHTKIDFIDRKIMLLCEQKVERQQ